MEIFRGDYYPRELTDWWLDNWISRVYGNTRTKKLMEVEVIHHVNTQGTRYMVTRENNNLLESLIEQGQQHITAFMVATNESQNHAKEFDLNLDE